MKKITFYLFILIFLVNSLIFSQIEINKIIPIPEEAALYESLHSIINKIKATKTNSEDLSEQNYLKTEDVGYKTKGKDIGDLPPLFDNREFYEMDIIPFSAEVHSDSGIVNCKIIISARMETTKSSYH